MTDIILHHYAGSPYSEKIRAILGYKRLPWRSVTQPAVMPKPDLVALTGGYRKIPVLQLGADVYCDSGLIARVLDRLQPDPPLMPAQHRISCAAFAALEQDLFLASVPVLFQPDGLKAMAKVLGEVSLDAFARDRAALFAGGNTPRPRPELAKTRFLPLINALDQQLAAQPYVLGEAPTLADFIAYHPVWFVRCNPGVAGTLAPFRNVLAWAERIRALGHGSPQDLAPDAALEAALQARSAQEFDGPSLAPDGIALGRSVSVRATDYGCDPMAGTLVHASVFEMVLERQDPRAGKLRVHFPRQGFAVAAQE
jgi:glutathione S-transferase